MVTVVAALHSANVLRKTVKVINDAAKETSHFNKMETNIRNHILDPLLELQGGVNTLDSVTKKVNELNSSLHKLKRENGETLRMVGRAGGGGGFSLNIGFGAGRQSQQKVIGESGGSDEVVLLQQIAASTEQIAKNTKSEGGSWTGGGGGGIDNVSDLSKIKNATYVAKGRRTGGYPAYSSGAKHDGLDIANKPGTPIRSLAAGIVIRTGESNVNHNPFRDTLNGRTGTDKKPVYLPERQGGLGNNCTILHSWGFKTRYCHLRSLAVKRGQKVKRGQFLGEMGNTGNSTGPHLHLEVRTLTNRVIDPEKYVKVSRW